MTTEGTNAIGQGKSARLSPGNKSRKSQKRERRTQGKMGRTVGPIRRGRRPEIKNGARR